MRDAWVCQPFVKRLKQILLWWWMMRSDDRQYSLTFVFKLASK